MQRSRFIVNIFQTEDFVPSVWNVWKWNKIRILAYMTALFQHPSVSTASAISALRFGRFPSIRPYSAGLFQMLNSSSTFISFMSRGLSVRMASLNGT